MRPKKYRKSRNKELDRAVRTIDVLNAFQEFRELVLPALQADVKSGLTAEEILTKYQAIAAARLVSDLARENGTAAARDILDRQLGRAVERKEHSHRLEKLPETEIDALLTSRLRDVTEFEDEGEE